MPATNSMRPRARRLKRTPRSVPLAPPLCRAKARLHQAIVSLDQPADSLDRSGLLLAQCRSELAEALDDQQAKANQPAGLARHFFTGRLVVGAPRNFGLSPGDEHGRAGGRRDFWRAWRASGCALLRRRSSPAPVMTVSASPKVTDQQLQSAGERQRCLGNAVRFAHSHRAGAI